jgi:hypothetical protein
MSVFNSPIDGKIVASLRRRQNLMGKEKRTPQELTFLNSNTSFIRLSSSVNVNGTNELAKANVLAGGLISNGKPHAGIGPDSKYAYSPKNSDGSVNLLGVRPMPGITSVSIDNIGAYGSTRKATVNFQCWDIKQLEILEKLYMRPGYTVLLEFGRNIYLNSSGGLTQVNLINNFFEQKNINLLDYLNKLYEKSIEYEGNYDAFFGYIVNYSWSSRNDGGYDCKTEILSTGEIVESLKANYSAAGGISFGNINSFRGLFADQYKYTISEYASQKMSEYYASNIVAGLCSEIHWLIASNSQQNFTGNNTNYKIPVTIDGVKFDIDYATSFHETKDQDPKEKEFLAASQVNTYITLESFCKLFTAVVIPNTYSDGKNKKTGKVKTGKLFEVTTKNRGYLKQASEDLLCLFNNYMTSTNPDVCLIKNPRWFNILNQNDIKAEVKPIETGTAVLNDPDIKPEILTKIKGWIDRIIPAHDKRNSPTGESINDILQDILNAYLNAGMDRDKYTRILAKNYQSIRGAEKTEVDTTDPAKPVSQNFRTWWGYIGRGGTYANKTYLVKEFGIINGKNDRTLGNLLDWNSSTRDNKYNDLVNLLSNQKYLDPKIEQTLKDQAVANTAAKTAAATINNSITSLKEAAAGYQSEQAKMPLDFKTKSENPSYGIIGNIYVNLKFLFKVANDPSLLAQDKNGKNNLSVVSYFNALVKPIQTALGNINTFELYGDPVDGLVRIVDLNYVNKDADKEIFEFEVGSNESIIRDLKFEAQISSEMSSMIAISAQSEAGATGLDNSTIVSFNRGIIDRMIPKKDSFVSGGNDEDVLLPNFVSSLSVLANNYFKPYFGGRATNTAYFYPAQAESYSSALRDIMAFISAVRTTDNKDKSFLPLKLSMTLDGISGLIIGNLFKVNQKFVPKYYTRGDGRLGYTIIKIDQQLQNNDWTTHISAYPFSIDSGTGIKIDDTVPFSFVISYNPNPTGETSGGGGGGGAPATDIKRNVKASQIVKDQISPILSKLTDSVGLKALIEFQATQEGFKPDNRNYRNNNPGNISKKATESIKYKGDNNNDKRFASFPTLESGLNATIEYIKRIARGDHKVYGKNVTLKTYIDHYAPPNENDTTGYLNYIINGLNQSGLKVTASTLLSEVIK